MRDRELRRLVGSVVFAAFPTLALTTACRTTGEATYVVRSGGRTCQEACSTLVGQGTRGSWMTSDVLACTEGTELEPPLAEATAGGEASAPDGAPLSTPVAVCRMRTQYTGGIGRRPEGLALEEASGSTVAGAYFARVEQLERAAAIAFERLARELAAHGAPPAMIEDARRSAREEVGHAAIAARWRERLGGVPAAIESAEREAPRSLLEVARENGAEGCVHETWGAVLASAQAASCPGRALRRDLARIAHEEAGHAALSHRIDRWARGRLGEAGRVALDEARARAIAEVERSLDEMPGELEPVGLPDRADAARLFALASRTLGWHAV
jgi:hypothetical protein